MTVFFTSDTNFSHAGARSFYARPFASVAEMDRALVERGNETVGPADTVWHLGDFALGPKPERTAELLAALHGSKHLIAGNNDNESTRARPGWVRPLRRRIPRDRGGRTVAGAVPLSVAQLERHGQGIARPARPQPWPHEGVTRQIDVGVDVWDFRPVALERLTASRQKG